MKQLLTLLFIVAGLSSLAGDNELLFDSANAAYAKNDLPTAITRYEQILSNEMESPQVYFNLGNAYLKSGSVTKAIINYERAKKLAPEDEDISTNLRLANLRITDKIEALPELFLTEWKNSFLHSLSERQWSWLCVLLLVTGLALFLLYTASRRLALRQLGFWGGIVILLLSLSTFFIARHQYRLSAQRSEAIITGKEVTVMGSPDEKGTRLFILHEGTKVNVTDENGDWNEVKLSNGNVGWMKKNELELI